MQCTHTTTVCFTDRSPVKRNNTTRSYCFFILRKLGNPFNPTLLSCVLLYSQAISELDIEYIEWNATLHHATGCWRRDTRKWQNSIDYVLHLHVGSCVSKHLLHACPLMRLCATIAMQDSAPGGLARHTSCTANTPPTLDASQWVAIMVA